jgi:predicted DNA binding CopG/RHH family protein
MDNPFESFQRGVLRRQRKDFMINERLKKRLKKDRPSTTITMRIPTDVVESLKTVAPMRGFTAYQTLLKSYISEGLRRDEVQFDQHTARKLAEALKRRGVAEKVLQEAMAEIASDS